MTKQISSEQEIGGVPILRVRDWLARDSTRTRGLPYCLFLPLAADSLQVCGIHFWPGIYADERSLEIGLPRRRGQTVSRGVTVLQAHRIWKGFRTGIWSETSEERDGGANTRRLHDPSRRGQRQSRVFWSVSRELSYMAAMSAEKKPLAISISPSITSRRSLAKGAMKPTRNTSKRVEGHTARSLTSGFGLSLR